MSVATTLIVGAGQAGAHAAVAAREAGLPGRLILLGDEPHHPYERPPLSKAVLTEDEEPAPGWFYPPQRYAALEIELRCDTHVDAIDIASGRILVASGEALPFDRLLLAMGARPRRLAVPGAERVLYLRTLDDARTLRAALAPGARVVCVGAGVIGLEVAAAARQRGCAVTVLEAAPTPLGRAMAPEIALWLAERHRHEGVEILCGITIAEIAPGAVICADGRRIPADLVIAGIGIVRNAELAEQAGLGVDNGILVDPHGRTNAPNVFAAGDVTAFWSMGFGRHLRLESWRHAQNHGIATGRAMAGDATPYNEIPWFWTDQYGQNIQVAGLPAEAACSVWRGTPDAPGFSVFHLDAAGRLVGATGVNAARDVRIGQSLIAAGASPDPAALADPAIRLQSLLPRD
jgi:NADPH-dependent 2,4-dienoyl-CoA reductase/sulfur reductase-like enzyme